jgi:hypothetical protein
MMKSVNECNSSADTQPVPRKDSCFDETLLILRQLNYLVLVWMSSTMLRFPDVVVEYLHLGLGLRWIITSTAKAAACVVAISDSSKMLVEDIRDTGRFSVFPPRTPTTH